MMIKIIKMIKKMMIKKKSLFYFHPSYFHGNKGSPGLFLCFWGLGVGGTPFPRLLKKVKNSTLFLTSLPLGSDASVSGESPKPNFFFSKSNFSFLCGFRINTPQVPFY